MGFLMSQLLFSLQAHFSKHLSPAYPKSQSHTSGAEQAPWGPHSGSHWGSHNLVFSFLLYLSLHWHRYPSGQASLSRLQSSQTSRSKSQSWCPFRHSFSSLHDWYPHWCPDSPSNSPGSCPIGEKPPWPPGCEDSSRSWMKAEITESLVHLPPSELGPSKLPARQIPRPPISGLELWSEQ